MNLKRAWHLGTALFWRSVREQRRRLVITSIIIVGMLIALPLLVLYAPGLVTPQTLPRLEKIASFSLGIHGGREALFAAALLGFGPYLITLLMSNMASSNAQGSFATEATQGSLELLFSAPYRASEIFAGIFISSLLLTFYVSIIVSVCTYGIALAFIAASSITIPWSSSYIILVFLMPLSLSICSALIALFISLMFPGFVKIRTGGTGNAAQILAMIPSFALFILMAFDRSLNTTHMSIYALIVGLSGSIALVWSFGRWFRPELVLER